MQRRPAIVAREGDTDLGHVLTERILRASARSVLDEGARDALAQAVAGPVDWDAVVARAVAEGTAGLLSAHLRSLDPALVPAPVRSRLDAIHGAIWARNTVLVDRWIDLTARLAGAGIPCLTHKGMALVHTVYGDPGLRPMTDVDLLVHPDDRTSAERVVREAGYGSRGDDAAAEPLRGYTLFARGDVFIDLHWHLARYSRFEGVVHVDHAGVWRRAQRLDVPGPARWTLGAEDTLLHLALHLTLGSELGRLVWFTDIDALLRAHERTLDWDRVLAEAGRWRVRALLAYTLAVAHASLGSPAPREALRQGAVRRALVAACVDAPRPASLRRELGALRLFLGEALLMDRARDVARVIARSVFPPAGWLRFHYRLRGRWQVALFRLLHPLRVCYLAVTRAR